MSPDSRIRPSAVALPRWIFATSFTIAVVALSVYAASAGVRGSDQYWYLADVETLASGHGVVTNTVFPVGLLGPGGTLTPPFIHNVLSIYLASLPATVVGPLGGWFVLNVGASLATAWLIYLTARTVASEWAALICGVLYPLLPVTFWHVTQPLTEASTALFAALAIFLLSVAGTQFTRWMAVVGAVGLLYASRESYLPLLMAVPVGFLVVRAREQPGHLRRALAPTVGIVAAAIAVVVMAQVMFGADNVRFSYTRLLHTAVPGQTNNMWLNFDLSPSNLADRLPFDVGLLVSKAVGHLAEQFVRFDSLPFALFYWTFNILTVVAFVMLWRCRDRPAQMRLVVAALSMVAIHGITLLLFQNQARYTVPALPGLLVVLAIAISGIPVLAARIAPRPIAGAVVLAILALGPTYALAQIERSDAFAYGQTQLAAQTLFEQYLAPSDTAMIVYDGTPQVLAYAARPRTILYVSPDYKPADYKRLIAAFPTRWLLAPTVSRALDGLLRGSPTPVGTINALGQTWGLYRIGD